MKECFRKGDELALVCHQQGTEGRAAERLTLVDNNLPCPTETFPYFFLITLTYEKEYLYSLEKQYYPPLAQLLP